ncbi:aminoglycoside resistance protein [Nocardioides gansuensis]|uniref:Aminoglycoside resistance protein n=1 Tax=Nocardioides gansuensis TaxID=2138300 RepID=A0A2T8FCL0_9ACTN|nr:aminoglycoside phosphotransferase family protein [Nocardioides gansuensis]PVG83436.1 aminoglycoside resistance protein [Nocardioides gansuensis]
MIPAGLDSQRRLGPEWVDWLESLPRLRAELLEEWQLSPDGEPMHGYCSLVLPVRTDSGTAAVLKIALPDEESEHEHLALQHWGGHGAVRLLRADPRRRAMLLERLHQETLAQVWDIEACEIVAGLWSRLHVPAMPQLRPLTAYVEGQGAALAALPRNAPVPRRMVEQAISLGRDFVGDGGSTGTVVHTDLHYGNVLAAEREPWLVIDPKPLSGDRHYEVAPMLWNRWEELTGDLRGGIRRRFHALVDAAGLDEDRARDWVVVRMVHNAMWTLQDAERVGRGLDADERDWITRCIALVKAVQD